MKRSPLRRSKGVRKRNPARRKSELARCYGSRERVEWVKAQRCICRTTICEGPSENAHIKTGGTGRKADADQIVPLCHNHHVILHTEGVIWFQNLYSIDLDAAARATADAWEQVGEIDG